MGLGEVFGGTNAAVAAADGKVLFFWAATAAAAVLVAGNPAGANGSSAGEREAEVSPD